MLFTRSFSWSVDIKTIIIFEIKWESNSETEIKYILHLSFDILHFYYINPWEIFIKIK